MAESLGLENVNVNYDDSTIVGIPAQKSRSTSNDAPDSASHDGSEERKSTNDVCQQQQSLGKVELPGLKQIQSPNYSRIGKAFWITVISVAVVLCIQQLYVRIDRYVNNQIGFEVEMSRNLYIDFPAFTICTSNATLFNSEARKLPYDGSNFWDIVDKQKMDVNQLWRAMSIDINDVTITDSCTMAPCFHKKYTTTYKGDCVTVYAPKRVFYIGASTGVNIRIKPKVVTPTVDKHALTIYCHENDWMPIYFNYYDSKVYHSFVTTISITRRRFTYLETKEEPCTTTTGTANCWRVCLEKTMAERAKTGCRIPPMAEDGTPMCSTSKDIRATYESIIDIFQHREGWKCDCPRRCSEVLFNMFHTVVHAEGDGDTVLNITIPDDSMESFVEVYSYSLIDFVHEVGSIIGVFLGFCFLTLFEIVELTLYAIRRQWQKRSWTFN